MGRVFDLLIVDDDPSQLRLVEVMIHDLGLQHRCHYASSGPKALDFLMRVYPFEHAPRPHLILLDLNMPGMDGCELLHLLKSNPSLLSIPVIVLSTSYAQQDVDSCYREHANAYVKKPADYEGTFNLLRDIDRFWAGTAVVA